MWCVFISKESAPGVKSGAGSVCCKGDYDGLSFVP